MRRIHLADDFALAVRHLPEPLLTLPARRSIERLTRMLPSLYGVLEFRLSEGPAAVDLSIICRPGVVDATRIDALKHAACPTAGSADEAAWVRLADYVRTWSLPKSRLQTDLGPLCLEFDLDMDVGIPVPRFFAPLHGNRPWEQERTVETGRETLARTGRFMAPLLGEPLGMELMEALGRFVEGLPDGARMYSVGTPITRIPEVLRVSVAGIASDAMPNWLEQTVGWGVNARVWREDLSLFNGVDAGLLVTLDVGPGHIPAKVGIVPKFFPRGEAGDAGKARLVDVLQTNGFCTGPKAEALRQWPGVDRKIPQDGLLGGGLGGLAFIGIRLEQILKRSIHHIKYEVHRDGTKLAKAYLSFLRTAERSRGAARH